ncbi:hypothetical protein NDU88_000424 [Pleurodeles waltl]|uniref:Gypsy retrotransposon integrase-like protein 1 n=1 Tax=Pleurodeles waltl TaxID=8319 RepID=A0AAV7UTB4_PLEWA|nr:hypothetical protein NDU88_000424 [Pleurodeles waltl]
MPHRKRVLLKNKTWALALLDTAAEVTIVRRNLLEHLEVKATDDFIQVETADMRVSEPDRVYTVTLQLEGDIERTINAIFWDLVVKIYDILLAEQDCPPDFVRSCPVGEEVIKPSFSPLVPGELAESYSIKWALAQAPALYRNHVGWDRDSPYHVITIKGEPQPQPQYPIKHEATAPELQADLLAAKHLHTRDNKTHLVIRVIAGAIGFTYVTFNEGETVPIGYKSHLYSAAEQRFAPTEKILTAVQMAVIKERPLVQGKRIIVVSPVPALEAVTKASVPNAKAMPPRWIQWATSLTATYVDYIFDPKLQTQEFLQYEVEYPVPADTLPIDQYQVVMYTDGSAQPAVGTKHQYSAACAVVSGHMEGEKFCPQHTYTQTLGDCTAQLAELKALLMALEHTDPTQFTLIVCDSYCCVQSFNEYLHYWRLNGFRDSKGNTIKHRLLWGKLADLKETLPKVHVVHTLGHQRVGIHVAGNTLADEAAKSAVAIATVAAVTRSSSKPDTEILAAIKATVDGTPYPKGFPNKRQYFMGSMLNAEVKIPGIGVREIPNKVVRPQLINAAHEGVASAHAGMAATISLLQARYWWPGLYKETKHTYAVVAFHSDQGPSFAPRAFMDTMTSLGVQLQFSSPFHPEGNSVVERLNRDLKQSLTARVLGTGRSWPSHLYGVQRALNNLPRRSLGGRTLYECLFGTRMFVLDLDGPGVEAAEMPFDINDRVTVLQELQQFREDNSSKSAASTEIKDVPVTPTGWIPRVGDLVREKVAVKKEFGPSYQAPVPVLGIHGTRTVILPPLTGAKENRFVSIDNVKLQHVADSAQQTRRNVQ